MPIEAPAGTLEVENAKFRVSSVEATNAVGIGTDSNDAYPLQVFKETAPDIRLSEGSTISSAARLYSNNSNLYIQTGGDFTAGSSGDVAFQTMEGQTTHMVIKSDGNVGVGTTTPSDSLHVMGAISTQNGGNPAVTPQVLFRSGPNNINSWVMKTNISDAYAGNFSIDRLDGTASKFVIKNNGNVGIGTAGPIEKAHIYVDDAASSTQLFIENASTSNRTGLTLKNADGEGFNIQHVSGSSNTAIIENFSTVNGGIKFYAKGDGDHEFRTTNSNNLRMVIGNSGNVGIGVTNPGVKLDLPDASGYNPVIRIGTNTTYDDGQLYSLRWGGSGLMGMGLYSSTRTVFGSQGIGLHIPNTEEYSVRTNGWAKLFALDGATYKAHFGGKVGIGVTNPIADLTVYGTGGLITGSTTRSHFTGSMDHLYRDTGTGSGNVNILARYWIASYGLIAVNSVSSYSDKRIKKNIVDADDTECLEVLRLLKPKKYQYKDDVERGTEPVWGFIAQEVRETLPYATTLRKAVVPNIYELANVSQSNVITFTNFNTSNLESNATTIIQILGIDGKEHDINLVEVIDEHTIRVEEDLTEWIGSMDETGNVIAGGNQLFIYGQQVDDFCHLTKDAIWTVATSALQEVDRQLQAEKAKVATLETQLASVLARLDALENT